MRRIGPCSILAKYGANAYKVELPEDSGLSPIFNVANLAPCKGPIPDPDQSLIKVIQDVDELHLPSTTIKKEDCILDSIIYKKTRTKEYKEHLVKWKG